MANAGKSHAQLVAAASNELAVRLHQKLSLEPKNVFFSPFSISVAMSMLFRGAKGETAAEMRSVLGYDSVNLSNEVVLESYGEILRLLAENDDAYTLAVANAVVSQVKFPFLSDYKEDLQKVYKALALEVDFAHESEKAVAKINEWVKTNTRSMIPKIFDQLSPATVMVLLNAVYFKGTWVHQFDPQDTRERKFYNHGLEDRSKDVPMMFVKKKFLFAENDAYKVLELPYKGENMAMLVLLPQKRDGLRDVEKNLTSDFLQAVKKDMYETEVRVSLPKMRLEYSKSLNVVFQELGLGTIFDSRANFRGISDCGGLVVSEIVHKAVVVVNEEGSEAAAVTAVVMMRCCLLDMTREFTADHPFLFFIYDKASEVVLFMGRVNEL